MLGAIVLSGFAVFYITWVLLFPSPGESSGPFTSSTTVVVYLGIDPKTGEKINHTHYVNAFDWVRRVFQLYDNIGESDTYGGNTVWLVKPYNLPVWLCPTCLSFWVSVAIFPILFFATDVGVLFSLLNVFCAAGVSRALFSIDGLQGKDSE